jgi:hypothetical protein
MQGERSGERPGREEVPDATETHPIDEPIRA